MPITLPEVKSGYNLGLINDNFQTIEAAWDEKLDRIASTQPNQLEQDLDFNSNRIINHPNARVNTDEGMRDIVLAEDITKLGDYSGVIPTEAKYTGDGTTTVYALPTIIQSERSVQVYVGGLRQGTDFYNTTGTTVEFTTPPASGVAVDLYCFNPTLLDPDAPIVVGDNIRVTAEGSTLERNLSERFSDVVNVKDFGASEESGVDNTSAILAAVEHVKSNGGGTILVDKMYEYSSPIVVDTSVSGLNPIVRFQGTSTRNSGFRYTGADDVTQAAFTIGVESTGSSGFVVMEHIGIYGQGQDIDGLRIYSGQRWCSFDQFTVRAFNGMLMDVFEADVFLNTWGSIYLLNGCRAFNATSEFNANTIDNMVIENMTYVNSRYDDTVPVFRCNGIGTNFNTLSIEACPSNIMMEIENTITINSLYQEANHATNLGVGARCVVCKGSNPKVLSGNVKLPGVNANTSDFYVIDLQDSLKADLSFNVRTPTSSPTSFQKAIEWGTSDKAIVDVLWSMFDGVGYPSRNEEQAFKTENRSSNTVNGVKHVFGQDPELVGRELMTKYSIGDKTLRCLYPNSNNRPEGFVEFNINPASAYGRGLGFSNRKDVGEYSYASAGDYGVYRNFTLVPNKRYLFSTIVGRPSTTNSRPRMRVHDAAGSQDYILEPRDLNFTGWTQISVATTLLDATNVRFYPLYGNNGTGETYLAMCFIIDLGQYEQDHGVSFDGMTTREIEDLINPSYISEEFGRQWRATTPTTGAWNRGERVYRYPPQAGTTEGWVCSVEGEFGSGTDPVFVAMANLT